jgi:hypothetical protein
MSTGPLKILVIDDEPPIRKLLRMGLTTQGYAISEAPNGKKSLELLAQKPDLVILDLGLPDMEGLGLLRMIRRSVWRSCMTNVPAGAAWRGEISPPLGRTIRIGACPITRLSFCSRKFSRDDELRERSVMEPASKLRWAQSAETGIRVRLPPDALG